METNKEAYYRENIIEYLSQRKDDCSHDSVINYVLKQKFLRDAIKIAVKSRDINGNKHPHQYRIQNSLLNDFSNKLNNQFEEIDKASSFEQLFKIIEKNRIHGIGEMTIYDSAFRIGIYKGIQPDKIYLHRGTRIGVERLLGMKINKNSITKQELPTPFNNCELNLWQLEDFFCIYKDIFLHNGDSVNVTKNRWCL